MTRLDWALVAAFVALVVIGLVAGGAGLNGLLLVPLLVAVGVAIAAALSA